MGIKSKSSKGRSNARPKSKPKSKPKQNTASNNAGSSNTTTNANTTANATPVAQPAIPFHQRASRLADAFGSGSSEFVGNVARGLLEMPFAAAGGVGRGVASVFGAGTEGQLLGSRLGKLGSAYYAMKKFGESDMYSNMMSTPEEREVRVKTEERKKKETKIREAIMGPRANGEGSGFTLEDLNSQDQGQDAGWREAIDGMDEEEYSKLASEAIKENKPNRLWNSIVSKAQQSGKKINTSKPLFLPNTFTKGGKQYAYAITYDKDSQNTEFVPIEIGKRPFDEESE
jgi:hypothetical protein